MGRIMCLFAACLFAVSLQVSRSQAAQRGAHTALADLQPTQGNSVKGTIRFRESKGKTHIVTDLTGLKPGRHGFHIHEKGDCSEPDGSSAGGHFNPGNNKHGAPDAAEHHLGDLGNIVADSKGRGHLNNTVDFLTVSDGPNSVVGRSLIVHSQEDDLQTQPTGNAGARLACGVIQGKK